MSLQDKFPAYGGRGPSDLRLGIALGVIATVFMVMRLYVRLRINKFGTTALSFSLLAWVCLSSEYAEMHLLTHLVLHNPYPGFRYSISPTRSRKPYHSHY